MELSVYEAWLETDRRNRQRLAATHPEYVQRHLETQQALDQKRAELQRTFPYSAVTEGHYFEHDYACRWCWQHISPKNGPCDNWQSDYPACPLVLATVSVTSGMYKDASGNLAPYTRKSYRDPGEHSHQGTWTSLWLGKTGYDYGFCEYFFLSEADRAQFLTALPMFTWDASWDQE